MSSYRLATRPLRRAAGFILDAVRGADLGGAYYPGGIVSYGSLMGLWAKVGGDPDTLRRAASVLADGGQIRVLDEGRGLIASPDDPEMTDRGAYQEEVVPLTTSRTPGDYSHTEAALPIGLGGTSAYPWDTFDVWSLDGNGLSVKSHLGRLISGA